MDEKGELSIISQDAMKRWDYRFQGGCNHCHLEFYCTNPRLSDIPALASAKSVKKCGSHLTRIRKTTEERKSKEGAKQANLFGAPVIYQA